MIWASGSAMLSNQAKLGGHSENHKAYPPVTLSPGSLWRFLKMNASYFFLVCVFGKKQFCTSNAWMKTENTLFLIDYNQMKIILNTSENKHIIRNKYLRKQNVDTYSRHCFLECHFLFWTWIEMCDMLGVSMSCMRSTGPFLFELVAAVKIQKQCWWFSYRMSDSLSIQSSFLEALLNNVFSVWLLCGLVNRIPQRQLMPQEGWPNQWDLIFF